MGEESTQGAGWPRPGTLADDDIREKYLPLVKEFYADIGWYEKVYGLSFDKLGDMSEKEIEAHLQKQGVSKDDLVVDLCRWDYAVRLQSLTEGLLEAYLENADIRRPVPKKH